MSRNKEAEYDSDESSYDSISSTSKEEAKGKGIARNHRWNHPADNKDSDRENDSDQDNNEESERNSNNDTDSGSDSDSDSPSETNQASLSLGERLRGTVAPGGAALAATEESQREAATRATRQRKWQAKQKAMERLQAWRTSQSSITKKNHKQTKNSADSHNSDSSDDSDDNDDNNDSNDNDSSHDDSNNQTNQHQIQNNTKNNNNHNNNNKQKKNKHRPTEASSKRADFYQKAATSRINERGIGIDLGAHRYKPADPRASGLQGHYNEEQFTHHYAFLQDMRAQEIQELKRRIAAHKTTGKRGQKMRKRLGISTTTTLAQDKERLLELQSLVAAQQRHAAEVAAQRKVKQTLKEQSTRVGKPVFFKRAQRKELLYKAKLEHIRQHMGEKKAEKVVTKRRKRVKSRDARRLAREQEQFQD